MTPGLNQTPERVKGPEVVRGTSDESWCDPCRLSLPSKTLRVGEGRSKPVVTRTKVPGWVWTLGSQVPLVSHSPSQWSLRIGSEGGIRGAKKYSTRVAYVLGELKKGSLRIDAGSFPKKSLSGCKCRGCAGINLINRHGRGRQIGFGWVGRSRLSQGSEEGGLRGSGATGEEGDLWIRLLVHQIF